MFSLVCCAQAHTDELWGLAIHPEQNLFLTCGYDKHVVMWDAEQHRPLWMKTMEEVGRRVGGQAGWQAGRLADWQAGKQAVFLQIVTLFPLRKGKQK